MSATRNKPRTRRAPPPEPLAVTIALTPDQVRALRSTTRGLNRRGAVGWVTLRRSGPGHALEFVFGLANR